MSKVSSKTIADLNRFRAKAHRIQKGGEGEFGEVVAKEELGAVVREIHGPASRTPKKEHTFNIWETVEKAYQRAMSHQEGALTVILVNRETVSFVPQMLAAAAHISLNHKLWEDTVLTPFKDLGNNLNWTLPDGQRLMVAMVEDSNAGSNKLTELLNMAKTVHLTAQFKDPRIASALVAKSQTVEILQPIKVKAE